MTDLSISVAERREMLKNLSEREMWPVLQSLLLEMSFTWAEITHGVNEQGRDLIACGPTSTGGDELLGVIVKAEKISGGVSGKLNLKTVIDQIELCLRIDYSGPNCRSKRKVNRAIVITNKSISKFARDEISGINIPYGSVEFWDIALLEKKISKYYPAYYLHMKQELHDYLIALREQCEQMNDLQKNLQFNASRKLTDVYVEIPMIERFRATQPKIGGQQAHKKELSSIFPEIKEAATVEIFELINHSKDMFIEGAPGSGKSCLLRISCIRLIENLLTGGKLPIPLFLNSRIIVTNLKKDEKIDLIKCAICVDEKSYGLICELLPKQQFILFVDGFDEIHSQTDRDKLLSMLAELRVNFSKLKIVVTSRPIHVWHNTTSLRFKEATLLPINIGSMTTLLERLITKPALYVEVLRELTESGILDKLPKTPLVITLVALLHEQESSSEIPSNLYELYELFCQVHLDRWGKKGGKLYDTKVAVLEILAYHMHLNSYSSVSVEDAVNYCNDYLTKRGERYPLKFLTSVIRDNSLIKCGFGSTDLPEKTCDCPSDAEIPCKEDCQIGFVHQSFQEYFCSRYLSTHQNLLDTVLTEKFEDPWWGSLGVFIAGKMKDIPELLKNIVNNSLIDNKFAFSKMMNLGYTAQAATLTSDEILVMACREGLELIHASYNHAVKMNEVNKYQLTQLHLIGALVYTYQHTYSSRYLIGFLKTLYEEERAVFLKESSPTDRKDSGIKLLALSWALATLGDITYMIDIGSISDQSDGALKGLIVLLMEEFQRNIDSGELKVKDPSTRELWHTTSESVRKLANRHRKMLIAAMIRKPQIE